MKVAEIMTRGIVGIAPEESVAVAARTLTRYNIGILPVCRGERKLCGIVTDRDLITRCVAGGLSPEETPVSKVMTRQILSVPPDMETETAAWLMGAKQIRRLPVVEAGKLCGMVSLGDIAEEGASTASAAEALAGICANVRRDEENR